MPTVETSIWLALRARVASLALSPVLPVNYPNEAFTPPATGYLRVTWIPNTTRRLFTGSTAPHERLGLLQIDVMAKLNQNAAVAMEIAGIVAEHFPADLRMTAHGVTCRVTKAPSVAMPMPGDAFLQVPVTISVEALV